MNTFPWKSSLIPRPWINWSLPSSRCFPPIPPHYLQSLALINWLFIFALMFVFCSLLPSCLSILNIFFKCTSVHIREIYSLITFNTVFEFTTWNHIRKGEPISLLPRLFTTSPGEGPNLSNYLFCCDHHLLPRFCLISCLLPVRLTILKIFCSFTNLPMQYHIQHHV